MMNIYGYVRVSTVEQNEDRQMIALRQAGVDDAHIYMDKLSGKDFNRPQYQKMLRKIKKKTICSTSRALIVLEETMKKSRINGVC